MTEENSTTSHLSVAMTSTAITDGNTVMPSSSSRSIEFYFHCALVVIGVFGIVTNGLILYALVASKQHKKHVLIVNQNALDLFTSFMMVIVYSLKFFNISFIGTSGYWLCSVFFSESLVWWGTLGSVINLAGITVERYLKVVWIKIRVRNWMINSAVAFSWIISLIYNAAVTFPTTAVVDGSCYAVTFWVNQTARIIEFVYNFSSFYVIILFIFIFCYWRILAVVRRQAKVTAGYASAGPSSAQIQLDQIQATVIKTMIFVSAFYAISWFPINIYMMLFHLNLNFTLFEGDYYLCSFLAYLYMCNNPFIYATKFDPVKEVLLRLIRCKKPSQ